MPVKKLRAGPDTAFIAKQLERLAEMLRAGEAAIGSYSIASDATAAMFLDTVRIYDNGGDTINLHIRTGKDEAAEVRRQMDALLSQVVAAKKALGVYDEHED